MTGSRIAGVRLHWHPFSIIPRRVRIALREKKIPCEEVEVDLPAGAHRTPAFLRLNPFAQVPVLEDGDLVVAESVAILEYLEERFPEPALLPRDAGARAVCRQYMLFAGDYVNDAWKAWMAQYFGPGVSRDDPSVRAGRERLAHHLDVLEARLADHRWLVDAYSLADVCYAPVVTVLDHVGLGELVTARPAVQAWVERLNARPAVRDTAPPRPGA
jgi:glutathione S-transferase